MQLPLFELPSDWRPPSLADMPSWDGARRIGVDIETCDPNLKQTGPGVRTGGYIVGVSFAIEDGPYHYLPFRHELGDNLDGAQVLRYLRDQARAFKGTVVGANLNYDLDYLAEAGVTFPNVKWQRDVQIADPLINELHDSYSLERCAVRNGLPGKDEAQLRQAAAHYGVNPKSELWKLPARHVGPYAEEDARLPLQLLRRQERMIDEMGLWPIYDLECQVQPVLLKMRRRGVKIDQDQLARVEQWSMEREKECLDQIHHFTDVRIGLDDIWKKDALVMAIQAIGMKLDKTPTGQPKLDKAVLNEIDHPVAEAILQARKVNKLRTTFAASIRTHMVNGRIHCTFNQLRRTREDGDAVGARYGRMSSEHPNLQQQPARDEFASMWRSIYVPDTDTWVCADYSQQEPRMLTHFAELCGLDGAGQAAQRYRDDPDTDNHAMMTQLIYPDVTPGTPEFKRARTYCKNIYLGLCYGMGGAKLAHDLGLPTKWVDGRNGKRIEVAGDEAQNLLDTFDRRAPFVRALARRCEQVARSRGHIVTVLGRRCNFPRLKDGTVDWAHKALNRLIQGSSADQTKMAVVELDRAGVPLQLQVHDEVDWSAESLDEARMVGRIMRECVKLNVPSKVDLEYGPSWGQATQKL
jgi:DNA polymerase I-like protein with 3'-5' exonuclease and polymerase domains